MLRHFAFLFLPLWCATFEPVASLSASLPVSEKHNAQTLRVLRRDNAAIGIGDAADS